MTDSSYPRYCVVQSRYSDLAGVPRWSVVLKNDWLIVADDLAAPEEALVIARDVDRAISIALSGRGDDRSEYLLAVASRLESAARADTLLVLANRLADLTRRTNALAAD